MLDTLLFYVRMKLGLLKVSTVGYSHTKQGLVTMVAVGYDWQRAEVLVEFRHADGHVDKVSRIRMTRTAWKNQVRHWMRHNGQLP